MDLYDLVTFGPSGVAEPLTDDRRSKDPSLSPDGSWVVFTHAVDGGHEFDETELQIMEVDSREVTDVTGERGWIDAEPSVSPDGTRIAFIRSSRDPRSAKLMVANSSGEAQRLVAQIGNFEHSAPAWSPDGRLLAVVARTPEERNELLVIDVDSGEVRTAWEGRGPGQVAWSPDATRVILGWYGYESGFPIREVILDTGVERDIPAPDGVSWTNASYAGANDRLYVMRYHQSGSSHRLEVIDGRGRVLASTQIVFETSGHDWFIVGSLSLSRCFSLTTDSA